MKKHPIYDVYVTPDGDVFSRGHKLTPYFHPKHGRFRIMIKRNGKRITKWRAQWVAETFIPNPDNLPEVNHIDEDKTNDHMSNLNWMTRQQNAEHSQAKHYLVHDLIFDKTIVVFNLAQFARDHNLLRASLNNTIDGFGHHHRSHHRGYKVTPIN